MKWRSYWIPALFGIFFMILPQYRAFAQKDNGENTNENPFRQLKDEIRSPNRYRTASGAPGPDYYQQKADYDIDVELDDQKQRIHGEETITYHNNSPNTLEYLWVQLDQNMRAQNSMSQKIETQSISEKMSFDDLKSLHNDFDGGFKIQHVQNGSGDPLPHEIVNTMMRIDLPQPLEPGNSTELKIKWWYNINDRMKIGGRSGYEHFEENDNYLYTIAQFYPRMAVYNEVEGWQNKQFLGRGEFSLPFGNFEVDITVPKDHVVSATGTIQNKSDVLTDEQEARLEKARSADDPVKIVTEEEAIENEKKAAEGKVTWEFEAEKVRDFAFASSRKFIWDAMGVDFGDRTVMAMSFYPREGNPLWERYSTEVVAHTLRNYSKHTFEYPYPVAQSINAKRIGMEYPMICFNYGRTKADGTYSERIKYGMISVIIHEIGHNFFPMIVNSDERQWTWMDEGLNTFLQYLTEQKWERDYPSRRGPASKIADYMKGDKENIMPIMTNSESIKQFGNNAYGKPATALNILRETVLGRDLFDSAFKTYAQRWKFKHPTPPDFFRTMEDASGVDLDWFWRGWFYTTDHVDLAIDKVKWYKVNTKDPEVEKPRMEARKEKEREFIGDKRNKKAIEKTKVEKEERLADFYTEYDPFEVTVLDKKEHERFISQLNEEEKELLDKKYNYYEVHFSNKGGLVMPIILEFQYADGSKAVKRIPAEIWKMGNDQVTKVFPTKKKVESITLDPFKETADVNTINNHWPREEKPSRFELFKQEQRERKNKMQKLQKEKEEKSDGTGSGGQGSK